jgi:ABC-type branched-subunit amino acid transport system ATPase component
MIHADDLHFSYPAAARPAIDGVSFDVARGECYGLLGPSGAGKSTTQRILMGLLRGYSGTAELFDQPLARLGRDMYQRIGVSFELPALYLRLNALENLRLFDAATAASRITVPMLMAPALFDPAVAPPCQFAVTNAPPKFSESFILDAGHFEYPGAADQRDLLRKKIETFFKAP